MDKENPTLNARCLCGACSYTAQPVKMETSVCHCETCRRWAGGALFSVDVGKSLRDVQGPVSVYASSAMMNRVSCSICSAPLYRESLGDGKYYAAMMAFKRPGDFDFTMEIFIDEKPSNYDFAGDRPRLTGDEFWQMMDAKK